MGLLRSLPDTSTFTDEDYGVIKNWTPPCRIVTALVILAHKLSLGDITKTVDFSYLRARNNADELLGREDLPEHARRYLNSYRNIENCIAYVTFILQFSICITAMKRAISNAVIHK